MVVCALARMIGSTRWRLPGTSHVLSRPTPPSLPIPLARANVNANANVRVQAIVAELQALRRHKVEYGLAQVRLCKCVSRACVYACLGSECV